MTDRLSPMEAIMWRVGQDATLRMTLGAVVILDRPPTLRGPVRAPRLRRRRRAAAAPPTRRPDGPCGPGRRGSRIPTRRPRHHLRSLSIAAPGSMRQVLDLVAPARVGPVRPRALAVGRDADRGARGRPGRPVPAGPPRPHRRRSAASACSGSCSTSRRGRRVVAGVAAGSRRTAVVGAGRRTARPLGRHGHDHHRRAEGGAPRSWTRRRAPVTSIPSTPRCAACSAPSMSPTRCPGS